MNVLEAHERRRARLEKEFAEAKAAGAAVRLGKSTSNLFRRRDARGVRKLDVRDLSHVLEVDAERGLVRTEGMTAYETLADATLSRGLIPAVVPQLKSITAGGAVSGLGIESASIHHGLVHETVERMEVMLGSGEVVRCSRTENADLFYGLPNSYGTLGYILNLEMRALPARRFVRLEHTRYSRVEDLFAAVPASNSDFLDGTVFSAGEMYLTQGWMVDEAPRTSDYTWMRMYYGSIRERTTDWLTTRAYLWRWDTDWFWCSKQFGLRHPLLRFCATPWLLNSRTYQRLMRAGHRLLPDHGATESVIQDVDVPLAEASGFLGFLLEKIPITPLWICPFRVAEYWPLYGLEPGLYVNFGFWDVIQTQHEPGFYNRMVENKLLEVGGRKALYSSIWYDRETFWRLYNKPAYDALKKKYDPGCVFPDLHEKCAGRGA
jgi:FAD/FMN-containing dehydrogenase